nr:ribosome silencing factor [Lachnoclostridium sp. Marseille-P6806]
MTMTENQREEEGRERSREMACIAMEALENRKAEEIRVIDISHVSVLADYFIIANGTNTSQIQALADGVQEFLGRSGYLCRQVEGYDSASWVLLDFGDIIVHIFDGENRLLYDLERIWGDGIRIDPESLRRSS